MIRSLLVSLAVVLFTLQGSAQPAMPETMPDSLIKPEIERLRQLYRLDAAALASYDKIITFDREVFVVKIHNITFSEVRFTYPHQEELQAINRTRISQILYADGRRDVFMALEDRSVKQAALVDTARIIIKNQQDWMKVKVTENPADVSGLVAKGALKARYEADKGTVSNDELMRQVGIVMKKKAAVLKAHYVMIETKFFHKPYGELPEVEVTGVAYGY